MYYTYVLLCRNSKSNLERLYIGFTNDLRKRVARHKASGTSFTKTFDSIELVYYEACLNKVDARKRELQLKTGFGRTYIKRRLEGSLKILRD